MLRGAQGGKDDENFLSTGAGRPHVQTRRSFNPLFRSATANVPATISDRPVSTLSLLSDTSTVRPTATMGAGASEGSEVSEQPDTPTLRRRHLPSLSLTLMPSASAASSIGPAATSTRVCTPRASPLAVPVPLPYESSLPSPYFASLVPSGPTLGTSPEGQSTTSSNSSASVSAALIRRVSLSDLRIPARISSAQAKIGQDLQRVKDFKDGVEELKRLRRIYRSLVSAEDASDSSVLTDASASSGESTTAKEQQEATGQREGSLDIPGEATAKVDHIFARVAVEYQEWWEIADVLIKLADGAEVVEKEEQQASVHISDLGGTPEQVRTRCRSEAPPRSAGSSASPARLPLTRQGSPQSLKSSHTGDRTQDASACFNELERASYMLDEGVDESTPTSPVVVSTTADLLPAVHSPPALVRSKSTSVFPTRPAEDGSSQTGKAGLSPERNFGSPRSQSLNASERQLDILRSMLKNSTSTSTSTITPTPPIRPKLGALAVVAEQSAPSSPVPSRLTAKPYLTPEKRLPTSFSLPAGLGSGSDSPSPAADAPKRSTTPASASSSSLGTPTAPARSRSRQESGRSKAETVSSGDKSEGGKKGKSRLREVSRAGMQGIKDFLKALTKSGAVVEREVPVAGPTAAAPPAVSFVDPPAGKQTEAQPANRSELRTPTRPSLAFTRRVVSDSPVGSIRHSCHPNHVHRTPMRNGLLAAAMAGTPETDARRSGSSPYSWRSGKTGSSSDEEEDWDRRSSDDEHGAEAETDAGDEDGASGGGSMLRSDTQATLQALPNAAGLPSVSGFDTAVRRRSEGPQSGGSGSLAGAREGKVTGTARYRATLAGTHHTPTTARPTLRLSTDSWLAGTKLVMTTEAMPTLLAKIDEVKLHCASCVTELR